MYSQSWRRNNEGRSFGSRPASRGLRICRNVSVVKPCIAECREQETETAATAKGFSAGGGYFTDQQQLLLAGIVHNAGIYNAILAGGFLWATCPGVSTDVARVMLIGAVIAGIFGAGTLKTWVPGLQVVVGAIGLYFIKNLTLDFDVYQDACRNHGDLFSNRRILQRARFLIELRRQK